MLIEHQCSILFQLIHIDEWQKSSVGNNKYSKLSCRKNISSINLDKSLQAPYECTIRNSKIYLHTPQAPDVMYIFLIIKNIYPLSNSRGYIFVL